MAPSTPTPKREQQKDEESLLAKSGAPEKDAHHQELQMQLCGMPVQLVAGAAYCTGAPQPP